VGRWSVLKVVAEAVDEAELDIVGGGSGLIPGVVAADFEFDEGLEGALKGS
jgi:hypothetical protein